MGRWFEPSSRSHEKTVLCGRFFLGYDFMAREPDLLQSKSGSVKLKRKLELARVPFERKSVATQHQEPSKVFTFYLSNQAIELLLTRLHGPQRICKLSEVLPPPKENGMT